MPLIAQRMNSLKPSPTIAVTTKAAELRAAGHDVIGLGAGEPDFDTPDHIKESAKKALDAGQTKYTPVGGTPAFKQAVVEKFKRDNGIEYTQAEVMGGCGAKHILYNAFMATLDDGDEVIIPSPYWVSYPDMAAVAGGVPVVVNCPESNGFKLSPNSLAGAITPKTKWLVLNSPSNPTGAAYTKEELIALGEVLKDHPQVHVMADDIYEHLVYDGFEFFSFAGVVPEMKARTLTINGVSKAYSMTGWRIGFCGGPEELIKAMTKLQSQSTSNPNSIAQAATIEALNGSHAFLYPWREAFKRRRDLVVSALNGIDGLTCLTPQGAFYVYPNCAGLIGKTTPDGTVLNDSGDVATYLLEDAKVAVVPGTAFGLDPHFRISYATSDEVLSEACKRIAEAVAKLS